MMPDAPTSFSIDTATEDFAGEGREIECPRLRPREELEGPYARRQMLLKAGGWTLSAVWGFGTYSTAGRSDEWTGEATPPRESPDAEIAAWRTGEKTPMIELHGDTVEGWISPASFLAAVEAAERDDEDGIRSALVRSDD